MGLKSLSLQMIPWCFHLMGGACRPDDHRLNSTSTTPAAAVVRLICADGKMRVYDRPVPAAELMKEQPRHLVCRSDAFFIGHKVAPLAAGDHLQPGQSYFLLPSQFFHSVLSFVTLAGSLLGPPPSSNNNGNTNNSAGGVKKWPTIARPFDVQKTASGKIQIRVSDEFLSQKVREEEDQEERRRSRVVTTEALEKEYKMLVRQSVGMHWRPKLETIRESSAERRRRRGVVGSLDRRRKKHSSQHDL